MSTSSPPHPTDRQTRDAQCTEYHDASNSSYPPETYMRETSELRVQSTPPLALLALPEVPRGGTPIHDAAHLYVTSSTSASQERSMGYPTTAVSSTPDHKAPPDRGPEALVHHQLIETEVASRPIPTSYPLFSDVGQASVDLPSTYRPGRCDEGQPPVHLPSIQGLSSSPQPAQSVENRTSMTSGFTPPVNSPPHSYTSGRSPEHDLTRPSQGGQQPTPLETRSEPSEQPHHQLPQDIARLDWHQERPKFLANRVQTLSLDRSAIVKPSATGQARITRL
ncbi:hypothetical protein P691DRAFT_599175 [Macrolepiota fuliginosa MF-IS2]|uniref:Uncharacterized protein n=1 Tax=Macrolepiota fuliginosa MF-IS2 TaxID=1400762 RepID=A0A9P5WYD3_9AGAR|nr:hypothetical protein P691DRAFT_599175 [Macrolepiota fuliginosa MF-IS2]